MYSGNLNGLLKDSNGYIWYHGQGNLFKFDGKKWEKIIVRQEKDSLNRIIVNGSLKEDNYGNLWLGNEVGLFYYSSSTGQVNSLAELKPEIEIFSANIHDIIVYSDNKIFFIANLEPYVMEYTFDEESKELRNILVSKVLQESSPVYYLQILSPDGNLWIVGNEHAITYNPSENNIREIQFDRKLQLNANLVYQSVIFCSSKGVIWIGTQHHGINSINTNTDHLNHYPTVDGRAIRMINDIEEDIQGNIWVSATKGLISINTNEKPGNLKLFGWEEENQNLYLQYINSMCSDEKGYILMVTQGGELLKLENCEEVYDFLPVNINFNVAPVYSVFATTRTTPDGKVIKVRNHKLASKIVSIGYNGGKEKEYLTYSIPGDRIRDFDFIDGQLWIGSEITGFAIFNPITKQELAASELNNLLSFFTKTGVAKIIKYSESELYLITLTGDVYFLSKKSESGWEWQKQNLKFDHVTLYASLFFVGSDGWVWTASPLNQLVGFHPDGEVRKVSMKSNENICSLSEAPGNNILVGLYNGLCIVNTNTLSVKTIGAFKDISIFNIIKKDTTEFWLTSLNKLYKFDSQTGKVDIISDQNGLPDCRFQANSSIRLENGNLGFGTLRKGIMHFSPDDVRLTSNPLTVKITGLKTNGETILFDDVNGKRPLLDAQYPYAGKVELNHFHKLVSIQFSALDYLRGNNIQYSYFLEGVDENWTLSGAEVNEVTYSNLLPGNYTFRIKATGTPGVWDGEETTIIIDIRPAWFQTILAKTLFLLIIVFLIAFFWRYSIGKVRLKEQLILEKAKRDKEKEIHKMKLQFFTNISHEFKTPLSLLFGPLKQLRAEGEELSTEEREGLFELMSRNIRHLMDMINQLMDFRKVENKAMKLRVRPTNISRFIEDEFNKFKLEADSQQKTIFLEAEIKEPVFGWVDSEKLLRILSNLLSNAIKYTSSNGIIRLNYKIKGNGVELKVCDNGAGIDKKHLPFIFERYYRIDEEINPNQQVPGTGIGLALCRDLAELMKGEISVDSTPGKGSCFHFWFPISASSFKDVEKEDVTIAEPESLSLEKQAKSTVGSDVSERIKPLLLIVEDNLDMQAFLDGILKNRFTLEFANNGFEGIEKCDKLAPDLVVSDVMMPEMDGFEMVKKLKTDIRISHIPIILLTALSSPEHQVEGLQTGADLYIQKPFDPEFLRISINNLIESRIKLRQKFGKKLVDVTTSEITITKTDEMFFDKIMKIIGNRLFDSEFKIEEIHHEVGMSRSQFFRKIKALTDQTAGDFVKSLRLKKAAELLKSGTMRVSDICYEVGFTDPKYFGKVFRKHFGMSPTEYSKEQNQ